MRRMSGSPLQGPEVDGYGCGATLWVTWKGSYDQVKKVEREWNKHEDRELLQEKIEQLATKAVQAPPPRWQFAALVRAARKNLPPPPRRSEETASRSSPPAPAPGWRVRVASKTYAAR